MMKKNEFVLSVFFLLFIAHTNAQNNSFVSKIDTALNLYNEISDFIKMEKTKDPKRSSYFVYVVRQIKQNDSCKMYSLGLIINEKEITLIDVNYYSIVDGSYVLVSVEDIEGSGKFYGLDIIRADIGDIYNIGKILFQSDVGFMSYDPPGIIYKVCALYTEKQFFEDSNYIAPENTIYSVDPWEGVIHNTYRVK